MYCNGVEIVLQEVAGLYCSIGRKLYYNIADCIARLCSGWPGRMDCIVELYCKEGLKVGKIVLQYRKLYCSLGSLDGWKCIAIHWFVLQARRLEAGLDCIAIQSSVL